jgi:tight adherence protein C
MIRQIHPREKLDLAWNPAAALERLSSQPLESFTLTRSGWSGAVLAHLSECLAQVLPETRTRLAQIHIDLKRAGYHQPTAGRNLSAVRYFGMMLSLVLFGLLAIYAPRATEPWCVFGLAIGMVTGWGLPVWHVRRAAGRRLREIEQSIPDLLDLAAACLSQGLSVPSTLSLISRDLRSTRPALANELAIVCRQAELDSLERALDDFEQRIDLSEIRSFTSLLREADQVGPLKPDTRVRAASF